jgi:hypothetical protein
MGIEIFDWGMVWDHFWTTISHFWARFGPFKSDFVPIFNGKVPKKGPKGVIFGLKKGKNGSERAWSTSFGFIGVAFVSEHDLNRVWQV